VADSLLGRWIPCPSVVGVLLAGGSGSRLGVESKPAAPLAGRALAAWPAEALAGVCERVAVVCKRDTPLPELPGTERWDEPDEPRHPLTGIVHALEVAGGAVLVCAADMPFVTADACRTLLQAAGTGSAVVASAGGVLQPTFGLYAPAALEPLRRAPEDAPLTRTVEGLDPVRVALPPAIVRNVNTGDDLAQAEAFLVQRQAGETGTEIT
jgi:molybdenum cofactor guanylyltransferase